MVIRGEIGSRTVTKRTLDRYAAQSEDFVLVVSRRSGPSRAKRGQKALVRQKARDDGNVVERL
jgi:hypothetical protein